MANSKRAPARAPKKRAPARASKKRAPARAGTKTAARTKPAAAAGEGAAAVKIDGRCLSRRIEFTARLSEHIRQRYEEAGDSPEVIARSIGVAKTTIQRLVREQAWTRAAQGPRDLSPAVQLEAAARALAASTLPPRSGGEGRRTLREQGEPGWGVGADTAISSDVEALLPPTPDPSPPFAARTGGGEESAAPPEQEAVDIDDQIERLLRLVSAEIGVYENLRAQLKAEPQGQREALKTAHNLGSLTSTLDTLRRMRAGQTAIGSHDEYDDDDIPADIDAFREALARRIEAFMASRPDEGDAGADDAPGGDGA